MQQKAKLHRKPPAQPNIRLGSGSGPTSNMFKVKNGKLMLTKMWKKAEEKKKILL